MEPLIIKRSDGSEREIALSESIASISVEPKNLPMLSVQSLQTAVLVEIANALWAIHRQLSNHIEVDTGLDGGSLQGSVQSIANALADNGVSHSIDQVSSVLRSHLPLDRTR